jgi:hypothetical protein
MDATDMPALTGRWGSDDAARRHEPKQAFEISAAIESKI